VASFGSDRVFDRFGARREHGVELLAERDSGRAEFTGALEQPRHERGVGVEGPGEVVREIPFRTAVSRGRRRERVGEAIGIQPMRPAVGEDVGPHPQVIHEGELERARPGPQLANRQRRDRLIRADEAVHPLSVEPACAAPNQLEPERVDPRQPRELVRRNSRQPPEVRRREVVVDVACRGRDNVKVVEEPFRGGRRRLAAPRVFGQRRVDQTECARVIVQPSQMGAAAAALPACDGEPCGQPTGMFFQRLDAQQLIAAAGGTRAGEDSDRLPHAA
jgi:hypothetical protein